MRERGDGELEAEDASPSGRRDRRRLLLISVCVAVPSIVAAVRVIRADWVPIGDQAIISIRAADVLTGRTPRLGQLSTVSAEVGETTRSPGPMGYWPFAVTARWGPLWGTVVVAAALSASAMVASVRLAARRGGVGLALALALGLALSSRALNPGGLVSTWNPALGLIPLVLLVLLAWSLGMGELRLLPVAVLVASFCAQVHTVLAVAALPVLAIGLVAGLLATARADRPAGLRHRLRLPPGSARPLLGAVVVGVVCWALPVLDEITSDPGNLTLLARGAPGEPSTWSLVGRLLADVLGVPPAFVGGDVLPDEQVESVFFRPAPTTAALTSVAVIGALAVLGLRAARRREREVVVPVLLVLALVGAGAAVARATPGRLFLTLTYTAWWLVLVGMLAWLVLGWAAVRAVDVVALRPGARSGRGGALVTAVGCVAIVAIAVLGPSEAEPDLPIHAEARAVGDAVVRAVDAGGRYYVVGHGRAPSELVAATAYRIRRAGARPVVAGNDGFSPGPRYFPKGKRCTAVVTLSSPSSGMPRGSEVIARIDVPTRDGPSAVRVTVGPDDGPPSC
ncbi:hypothetical protein HC251_21640 [Iamia sp. SCSIO 61187]|uniref:hypothetical protein n=1 Tax=Iamia sp. SCSIO 61187 TaxID=2722752 RepID=UPI001C62D40E|nr:hypothetical protein [Iamia sp. SCSIO 61187]QYG94779.1 hypothetical protein HC251_21640 [Iamia sp. SCSIO 61187]